MKKYYKIFRIDMPSVEIRNDRTDEYETHYIIENCLVQDGGGMYESEEEAERVLDAYCKNSHGKAKSEEYVIVKCYKMEE